MKILQIAPPWIDTPPSGYGGTEWVINNITKGLVQLGHDVTLFATKNSHTNAQLDYVFDNCLTDMGVDWQFALPSVLHYHQATLKAKGFDIVHAHMSSFTDLALMPFLSDLYHAGIPNVVTIHSHIPLDTFSHMDSYYLEYYGKDLLTISISNVMEKELPQFFRNGYIIHNSLDTSTLQFNPNSGNYLTWLGQIIPGKGLDEAILIAKEMGEQLIFAGMIDGHQERSVQYFNEKIKPHIDGNQIIFLGPADLKLKNKLLGEAKAFLYPINWEEPFGMVMIEAMACGTPVVAYTRGAVPEIVEDTKTGFTVHNKEQMKKAIKEIKMIDRTYCRKYVENNFSIKAAAIKHIEVYKNEIDRLNTIKNTRLVRHNNY